MKGFGNKGGAKVNGMGQGKGDPVSQMNQRLDGLADIMTRKFQDIDKRDITHGHYKVAAEDAERGAVEISTGLKEIAGHIIQIYRAGQIVTRDAHVTTGGKGILSVENGERSYVLTKGDVIMLMIW